MFWTIASSFYIIISVLGCADLVAPENAWHKRHGSIATIGCTRQNKTWHLKCDGERWQGVVGSCEDTGIQGKLRKNSLNYGICIWIAYIYILLSGGGMIVTPDEKGSGLTNLFTGK